MRTAVVTASYAADLERCRLLCDSMDVWLQGDWTHYILVERRDLKLFRALVGPRRVVVDEREILPDWLRPFPDPLSFGHRRMWLGPHAMPLRGWHVQQLRRLGMGRLLDEPAIFSADSDVALLRTFDPAGLWQGDRLKLYRRDNAVTAAMADHLRWVERTDALLGRAGETGPPPHHDYINTLIGWRTDTLRALLEHVENVNGENWMRAIARSRAISECTLYGRFVDEVCEGAGHVHTDRALCHVMWNGDGRAPQSGDIAGFLAGMEPQQIGIGIQSFIGHDLADIRRAVLP